MYWTLIKIYKHIKDVSYQHVPKRFVNMFLTCQGVDILHPKNRDNPENPGFSDIVASNIQKWYPSWELTYPHPLKGLFQGTVFESMIFCLGTICELSITIGWVVATQIFFIFNPKIGEDFHPFWRSYFSDGLVETTNWMGFLADNFLAFNRFSWEALCDSKAPTFGDCHDPKKPPHDVPWCTQKQPCSHEQWKSPKILRFQVVTSQFQHRGVFYQPYLHSAPKPPIFSHQRSVLLERS